MAFMGAPLRENWIATARSPGRARSAAAQAPGLVTSRPSMDVMMSPRRMPAASTLPLMPTTATSWPATVAPIWRRSGGQSGIV